MPSNVSRVYLPGYISTYFTCLGTFYPNYTETQRVGILPDIEVLPTIEGLREGRDEVMLAALEEFLEYQLPLGIGPRSTDHISIYPNPVDDVIIYEIESSHGGFYRFEITDLSGNILWGGIKTSTKGTLDISSLSQGIYFLTISNNNQRLSTHRLLKK